MTHIKHPLGPDDPPYWPKLPLPSVPPTPDLVSELSRELDRYKAQHTELQARCNTLLERARSERHRADHLTNERDAALHAYEIATERADKAQRFASLWKQTAKEWRRIAGGVSDRLVESLHEQHRVDHLRKSWASAAGNTLDVLGQASKRAEAFRLAARCLAATLSDVLHAAGYFDPSPTGQARRESIRNALGCNVSRQPEPVRAIIEAARAVEEPSTPSQRMASSLVPREMRGGAQ